MSLSKHTHKDGEICMLRLHLKSFSIQVYDVEKSCEECGVVHKPLYNFYMIACCGNVMRVCGICNWETVPCLCCKENNVGGIIINKKKNHCDMCAEEKIIFREIEKIKSNI